MATHFYIFFVDRQFQR